MQNRFPLGGYDIDVRRVLASDYRRANFGNDVDRPGRVQDPVPRLCQGGRADQEGRRPRLGTLCLSFVEDVGAGYLTDYDGDEATRIICTGLVLVGLRLPP